MCILHPGQVLGDTSRSPTYSGASKWAPQSPKQSSVVQETTTKLDICTPYLDKPPNSYVNVTSDWASPGSDHPEKTAITTTKKEQVEPLTAASPSPLNEGLTDQQGRLTSAKSPFQTGPIIRIGCKITQTNFQTTMQSASYNVAVSLASVNLAAAATRPAWRTSVRDGSVVFAIAKQYHANHLRTCHIVASARTSVRQ
ncbi:hypothetical protein V496_08721 [Pseudogymnoascus sp. VKM F-4515 (FW-2607)]|nr:hypothetical protein V496_08721 [Pseudogymnoascus sp. VKM F-4515 (FW-2607)]